MPNSDINHCPQQTENLHQGHHCASFLALRYVCKKNCYSPQGSWEENTWELMGINCTHSCEFFSSGCHKRSFRSFHSFFSAKEIGTIPWCYFSSLTGFNFSAQAQTAAETVARTKTEGRGRKVLQSYHQNLFNTDNVLSRALAEEVVRKMFW